MCTWFSFIPVFMQHLIYFAAAELFGKSLRRQTALVQLAKVCTPFCLCIDSTVHLVSEGDKISILMKQNRFNSPPNFVPLRF